MKSLTSIRPSQGPGANPAQPGSPSRALWSVVGTVLVDIGAPLRVGDSTLGVGMQAEPGPKGPNATLRRSHSTTERDERVPGDVRGAQPQGVDELVARRVVEERARDAEGLHGRRD